GTCSNCLEIRTGTSFDVIEIDGASNRSINDIRELRENVNFAPLKSKYKIYIIDEVHMLTKEAFNALLKTLEEPPPHVVFMFATTEIHQIPDTILSRCQKFFFKKIPVDSIVGHLRHIVEREGHRISDLALYPIARAAEGSMRDAQSLLDQVISFSDHRMEGDEEIGQEDALSILGIVPVESYMNVLGAVAAADAAAAMSEVHRVSTLGVDIPRYVSGFADMLRTVRLIRNGVSAGDLLGLSDTEVGLVREVTAAFHDEELSMMFRISAELQSELKFSTNERINLEMALLDMIGVKTSPSLSAIISRLDGGASPPPKPAGIRQDAKTAAVKAPVREKAGEGNGAEISLHRQWDAFLEGIKDQKQYLHCILKPSKVSLKEDVLRITYPGEADHAYYSRILEARNMDFIKTEMSALFGRKIQVVVSADTGEEVLPGEAAAKKGGTPRGNGIDGAASADTGGAPMPEAEMIKNPGVDEYNPVNPAVEKIKNAFHGRIVDKGDR
ncbi:MAG: DNA polymerase III subunit gamma/tau, partial [Chrysiogenales bacterium]